MFYQLYPGLFYVGIYCMHIRSYAHMCCVFTYVCVITHVRVHTVTEAYDQAAVCLVVSSCKVPCWRYWRVWIPLPSLTLWCTAWELSNYSAATVTSEQSW